MKLNQYSKVAAIAIIVCLGCFSCEDFADETFTLTATDAAGIAAMSDTLEIALRFKTASILNDGVNLGVILTGTTLDTALMTVDTNALTTADIITALNSTGISGFTPNDTAYVVTIGADSVSYRPFAVSSTGTYVFYIDHHVSPSVFNAANGARVEMISDDMSPELIAGLYDLPGPVPVIKGRYEYELTTGDYVFELARMEATVRSSFRVVLVGEQ